MIGIAGWFDKRVYFRIDTNGDFDMKVNWWNCTIKISGLDAMHKSAGN